MYDRGNWLAGEGWVEELVEDWLKYPDREGEMGTTGEKVVDLSD